MVFASVIFIACASSGKQKTPPAQQDNMSDYFATEDEGIAIPEQKDDEAVLLDEEQEPDAEKNMEDYFATEDEGAEQPSNESAVVENTPKKSGSDFTIPIMQPEYQKDPQGLRLLDANGQPIIIFRSYDADKIKKELYTLEQFGPNPYLQQPPVVDEEVAAQFAEVMAAIRSLPVEKKDKKGKKKPEQSDAEKNLQIIIDEQSTLSGPAYNMAVLKYQQKDFKKALEYCEVALQRNFYNQDARNLQAFIYREKSDFEKSESLHKENLKVWAGYKPAYRNLGILYDLYMGKPEEGLPYYQQYNALLVEQDRQVLGWVLDIQRRLKAQRDAEVSENQAAVADSEQEVPVTEGAVEAGENEGAEVPVEPESESEPVNVEEGGDE